MDVAFTNPINLTDDEFDIYPLINDKMVLFLSIRHKLAERNIVPLSELSHEKFLIVTGLRDDFVRHCHQVGFEPNIISSSIQAPTIKELVEEGLGIAPFTTRIANALLNSNTKIVHFTPILKRSIALVIVKNKNTNVTKVFKDFVLKHFGSVQNLY